MPRITNPIKTYKGIRDRRRLLAILPKHSVGAEIGVWKGDFSAQILRQVQPRKLHLIDPWKFVDQGEYAKAWYGGGKKLGQEGMDAIAETVCERFSSETASGCMEIHRLPSTEAATQFQDNYFDWVYIDGNHLFDFVLADLKAFTPKVKPGGFIAGDDYAEQGWWDHGVQKAVNKYVADGHAEIHKILGDQFVLRRPADSPRL